MKIQSQSAFRYDGHTSAAHLIIISSHNIHIRRNRAQVIVRLLVTDIARADDLLDFSGNEELLELCWEVVYSVGNVEVTDDEDEDHSCGDVRMSERRGGSNDVDA